MARAACLRARFCGGLQIQGGTNIKVVIAGYYGAGNAGDDAILESMLADLRRRIPDIDAVVVSGDPSNIPGVLRTDRAAVVAAVRDCDVVLLGGGGLLQDYWGMGIGELFNPAADIPYASYAALAALFDKPLMLYAVGVGPLATSEGRRYTRMVCEQAQVITVRDEASKALLVEVGVAGERVKVTADPAFGLEIAAEALALERPVLGVAVRNWGDGAWESGVAAAVDEFCERHGGSILLIPFERFGGEDDVAIARRMRERLRWKEKASIYAGRNVAAAVGCCDVLVGMRYHSVVFAMRQGVATIGLAYDPKVRNLFEAAECAEYCVELSGELGTVLERAFADSGLGARLRVAGARFERAAAETAGLVVEATQARMPVAHEWLDELWAASANDGEWIRPAIAERRPYDVICLPGIEWDFRRMRAQQLMAQFGRHGHRVFFVSPGNFLAEGGKRFAVRRVDENVWEVRLAAPRAVDIYSGEMAEDLVRAVLEDVGALAREFGIAKATTMPHLATWSPVAYALRAMHGWPVVYDCMDDWSGFAWMPEKLLEGEAELVRKADAVVVTAQKLWDKWSPHNPRTVLARNAADVAHFQGESGEVSIELPAAGPVVGFFGAIDSWFDVELVRRAAVERPQYFFALIGGVYDAPVAELERLANVRFYGHQPYESLPACLRRFDACIIPFKINQVTEATDPVKFYEYLAQGKPVVATRLPELEPYRELLRLADGPEDFVRLLDEAVGEKDAEARTRRLTAAAENTWEDRYETIDSAIREKMKDANTPGRILFAYPVLILGGVEVILKDRIRELQRRGWRARLVGMEDGGGRAMLEASGIECRIAPGEPELMAEIAEFGPDWIVSIDTPAMVDAARRCAGPEGAPAAIVYECHSTYPRTLAPLVERGFFNGVRGVIVPSPSQERRVRSLVTVDRPIEVIPNALSTEFLAPTVDPVEKPDGPVVLWVGRLDAVKNWRAFVELAKALRDRTQAEFRLVSGGPYVDTEGVELERAVEAMGGRLRWMREVEHARMPAMYRAVAESGGCMVSTSRAESFGMAVLEAMACGCPVVVPEIEGLRDLVRDGQTGRSYRAGDTAAACEEVLATLGDEAEHRAEMVEAARRVAMQFHPEAAAERFLRALALWSGAGPEGTPRAAQRLPGLPEVEGRRVVIIPPAGPGRPWQWAQALAREGCVVFYCDPQRAQSFEEVEPRLYAANVALEVFAVIDRPVVLVYSYNLEQVERFRNPVVVIDGVDASREPSLREQEWLVRAAVTIAESESEPQAAELLEALDRQGETADDPERLKALLRWRERQVDRLEGQIRERDRPAVDILHGAVTEQKRIIEERDKGIAFLRRELAGRERIVAERDEALEFLKGELALRDAELAKLKGAVEKAERERGEENEDLRQRLAEVESKLAAREEGIEYLKGERALRDEMLRSRDEGIEFLKQQVVERDTEIGKLRESVRKTEARLPWWSKGGGS